MIDAGRRSRDFTPSYFGSSQLLLQEATSNLIAALLVDGPVGDAVVLRVRRMMALLQPLVGSGHERVGTFVVRLIWAASGIARDAAARQKAGAPYRRCSPAVLAPFASAVFPVLKSLLFSRHQKEAVQVVPMLAAVNYELARDDLFPFALANMVNYEMIEFAAVCGRIVAVLVRVMFEAEHFQENVGILVDVIEKASENALPGASGLRGAAFSIIKAAAALIGPVGEESQIGIIMAEKFRNFVSATVEFYKTNAQGEDKGKGGIPRLLSPAYFAAFGTKFIEEQLPWIFQILAQTDSNSKVTGIFGPIVAAHPALMPGIVKGIVARLGNPGDTAARFWWCALAATLVPSPELIDVFEEVVRVISATIATDNEKRFELAQIAAMKLAEAANAFGPRTLPRGAPGELAKLEDIKLDLYRLPEGRIVEVGQALFAAYRPALDSFAALRLQEQLNLIQIFSAFGRLFAIRGDIATGIPRALPPGLDAIFAALLEYARAWLAQELNLELIKEILNWAGWMIFGTARIQNIRRTRVIKWVNDTWAVLDIPMLAVFMASMKQLSISTFMVPHLTPAIEIFTRDVVFPLLFHDFGQIRDAVISFLGRGHAERVPSLFAALADAVFAVLERSDKTEGEFIGALHFIERESQAILEDPALLLRCVRGLFTMTYNPEWKVDALIKNLMSMLENDRVFIRCASHLAPQFTELQRSLPALRTGSLSEYWIRFLTYFIATGPSPCEITVFECFWRDLLNVERGRKRLVLEELSEFVWALRGKVPRIKVNGYPGPEYFIDSAALGFWADPRTVRVAAGPASREPSEVRDWLETTFSVETAGRLIAMFTLQREPTAGPDTRAVSLWKYLAWAIGPALLDSVAAHIGCDDELPSITVRLELAAGVAAGLRRWPEAARADAVARVVAPIVLRFATRGKAELAAAMSNSFHLIVGDSDFRRAQWLFERIEGWLEGETLRVALHLIGVFVSEINLSAQSILKKFVVEKVLPRLPPLDELPQPVIAEFADIFQGVMDKGASPNPRFDFGLLDVLFGEIIDKEKSTDNLVAFLRMLSFSRGHAGERIIPFIAPRITRFFALRTEISVQMVPTHVSFTRQLGFLPWHAHHPLLNAVIDDLIRLYQTSQWFVQEQILHFVHGVCFSQMFVAERPTLRRIFNELLALFLQNERAELRRDAVRVVRMLIPTIWDDFGEFYAEAVEGESRPVIAAANAVALVGAVIVINKAPQWMPALLQFLISAYRKIRLYAPMINTETAQFWKKIGSREIPEIDEFRSEFSSGYFA
jgi:hypothetical protein